MLLIEHLALALFIGIFVGFAIKAFELKIGFVTWLSLTVGLLAANIFDLDHYRGSLNVLFNCALVVVRSDPFWKVCEVELQRGYMHTPWVLIPLGVVLWYFYKLVSSEKRELSQPALAFTIGVWFGWVVHLWGDNLLF